MSYSTLITGPERRRRWSEDQKLELLAEAFGPGGSVTETARRADIHTSLLYRWRRATLTPPPPGSCFTPAVLIAPPDEPPEPQHPAEPTILVELPSGARVHVLASAPADLVADSDDAAQLFRDDLARCSDLMPPSGTAFVDRFHLSGVRRCDDPASGGHAGVDRHGPYGHAQLCGAQDYAESRGGRVHLYHNISGLYRHLRLFSQHN